MRHTWCCQCPEATPGAFHGLPWTCPEAEGVVSCRHYQVNSWPIMTHPSRFVLYLYCTCTVSLSQGCGLQKHVHLNRIAIASSRGNSVQWMQGEIKCMYDNVTKQEYAKGIKVFSFESGWVCRFRRYRMKCKRGGKHSAAKQLSVQYPWRGWSRCEGTAHIRCTNSNEGGRTHRNMEVLHTFCWAHLRKDATYRYIILRGIVCHNSHSSFCDRLFKLVFCHVFPNNKYVQVTSESPKRQPQAKPSFATLFHHSHEGDPWMSTLKMPRNTEGKWPTQQDISKRPTSTLEFKTS